MITTDTILNIRAAAARRVMVFDPNNQFAREVLRHAREEIARREAARVTLAKIEEDRARANAKPRDVFNHDDAQALVEIAARQKAKLQPPKYRKPWNSRPDLNALRAQILCLVYQDPGIGTTALAEEVHEKSNKTRRALIWLREGQLIWDQDVRVGSRRHSEWYPGTKEESYRAAED